MGAGEYPSGSGPAGADPVQAPPARADIVKAGSGKKFDPYTRTWPIDANGFHEPAHWLDTWVVTNLHYIRKTVRSSPETGNPVSGITHIGPSHEQRVKTVLATMLKPKTDSGQITVLALVVEARRNATLIGLDYRNNLTGETNRPRVTANA